MPPTAPSPQPAQPSRAVPVRLVLGIIGMVLAAAVAVELVLAGDSEELEASRQHLFELAGTLCEELGGSLVNVRVRFSNSKSGVMRSVSPSSPDAEPLVSKA